MYYIIKNSFSFLYNGSIFYVLAVLFVTLPIAQELLGVDFLPEYLMSLYNDKRIYFYLLLFVSAFLESIFIVSFYFPGSFSIALVFLVSRESLDVFLPLVVVWIGFMLGILIDYYLGNKLGNFVRKLGHNKFLEKAEKLYKSYGNFAIVICSIHPNYIGTLSICLGMVKANIASILVIAAPAMAVSVFVWAKFIATVADGLENSGNNYSYYIAVFFLILGIYNSIRALKMKSR